MAEHSDSGSGDGGASGGGGNPALDDLPKIIISSSGVINGESVDNCEGLLHFLLS